jgi:hypothetical protein
MTMKFKVLHGKATFRQPGKKTAKRYHQGEVCESDRPLDKIFRNKFLRLDDATPVSSAATVANEEAPQSAPAVTPALEEGKPAAAETAEPKQNVAGATFELKHNGGGYWAVINAETGKPMNDKGLRKDAAEELLLSLQTAALAE